VGVREGDAEKPRLLLRARRLVTERVRFRRLSGGYVYASGSGHNDWAQSRCGFPPEDFDTQASDGFRQAVAEAVERGEHLDLARSVTLPARGR
jgi:hypothetical protein